MRDDMHKKVIERPRWASDWATNESVLQTRQALQQARAGRLDWEDLPARAAARPRRGCRKGLTDTLSPLQRFLRARRGALWDDVYGELRAQLSPRAVIHQHIFQHLAHMVHTRVVLVGDRVYAHHHHRREIFYHPDGQFYVHPETGRLCEPTHRWQRPAFGPPVLPPLPRVLQAEDRLLLQVEGVWYAVQTAPFHPDRWDVFSHACGADVPIEVRIARYGEASRLASQKRTLSRRDKRRAGLLIPERSGR